MLGHLTDLISNSADIVYFQNNPISVLFWGIYLILCLSNLRDVCFGQLPATWVKRSWSICLLLFEQTGVCPPFLQTNGLQDFFVNLWVCVCVWVRPTWLPLYRFKQLCLLWTHKLCAGGREWRVQLWACREMASIHLAFPFWGWCGVMQLGCYWGGRVVDNADTMV